MSSLLKAMEANLSESDVRMLKSIYEPRVVGVPGEDSRRSITVMPDGEIRVYGRANIKAVFRENEGDMVYLSSRDCGLSWKPVYAPKGAMGSCVYDEKNKRFLTVKPGTWCLISDIGPDDTAPRRIRISTRGYFDMFQPIRISTGRWLCPAQARTETFIDGLKNLTTHVYVKSVSESQVGKGLPGHCAWNRTNGALLVPDPQGNYGEALQITRIDDPRLVSPLQGAVWNFPAMRKGRVDVDVRIEGAGLRLSLTDRWFNAADEYIWYYAQFTTELEKGLCGRGEWVRLSVHFECDAGKAVAERGGKELFAIKMKDSAPNGISYLHLQTLASAPDPRGAYVRYLHAEEE